jgi:hypothetical protein
MVLHNRHRGKEVNTVNLEETADLAAKDLAAAEAQLAAVTGRVEELRAIHAGLQLALQRYGQEERRKAAQAADEVAVARAERAYTVEERTRVRAAEEAAAAERRRYEQQVMTVEAKKRSAAADIALVEVTDTRAVGATARVLAVLRKADRPLYTGEVRELVNASGPPFKMDQVRSTLHYLNRKARIRRLSPGLWDLPGARKSTTSFGPADGGAGPNGSR